MRAGYLGPPGTFSHEALLGLPGAADREPVAIASIHAAVLAVQRREVDAALVPIENSVEGSVNVTLDALALEAPDVEIAGEVLHPVHHCLIAREPMGLAEVGYVVSHPQGTAQCAAFLRAELPRATVLPAASTAEAVRGITQDEPAIAGARGAAIASRAAAELYGGHVLRAGIEDVAGNETRFVWLAPPGAERLPGSGPWKTALVWWGAGSESPGWLVRCLSEFAFRGVNMTRIESRPRRDLGIGEYMFFADLDGAAADGPVSEAVAGLRAHAEVVRVLGSFPAAG
jgi:prephenate dehydratase